MQFDRTHAAATVVAIAVLVAVLWWRARHEPTLNAPAGDVVVDPRREDPPPHPGDRTQHEPSPQARDAGAPDRAAPDRTARDRALRDEVRRRIFLAWQEGADATAAVDPLHDPMPNRDGVVDPDYLRARIREDFIPMAGACYDSLLVRQPGVEGRVVLDFVLVGDPLAGGVVDEARVDTGDAGVDDAGVNDSQFQTCLRESMLSMAFRPPPGRGRLRVRYPVGLRPDPPDAATATDR